MRLLLQILLCKYWIEDGREEEIKFGLLKASGGVTGEGQDRRRRTGKVVKFSSLQTFIRIHTRNKFYSFTGQRWMVFLEMHSCPSSLVCCSFLGYVERLLMTPDRPSWAAWNRDNRNEFPVYVLGLDSDLCLQTDTGIGSRRGIRRKGQCSGHIKDIPFSSMQIAFQFYSIIEWYFNEKWFIGNHIYLCK